MAELQIKNESLPTRCEICHQADQFDANTTVCQRCAKLNIASPLTTETTQNHNSNVVVNRNCHWSKPLFRKAMIAFIALPISMFIIYFIACWFQWLEIEFVTIQLIRIGLIANFYTLLASMVVGSINLFTIPFRAIRNNRHLQITGAAKHIHHPTSRKPSIATGELVAINIMLLLLVGVVLPNCQADAEIKFQSAAISILTNIYQAQDRYKSKHGKANYASTLNELEADGLLSYQNTKIDYSSKNQFKIVSFVTTKQTQESKSKYLVMITPRINSWPFCYDKALYHRMNYFFLEESGEIGYSDQTEILPNAVGYRGVFYKIDRLGGY